MKPKNRFYKPFALLILAYSSLPVVGALAEEPVLPDAQYLLNAMSQASHELNYDGIFIYRKGEQIDTMRLVHKVGEDGEHERLVSLSGTAREVIRDQESVRCVFPNNRQVFVGKFRIEELISSRWPEPIESITSQYTLVTSDRGRIAGRDAWIIDIIPKDDYRYGYQLWIGRHSKLLLKFELKNELDATLEQIMFTQLDVHDLIPDSLLQPSVSTAGYTRHELDISPGNTGEKNSSWEVGWTPNGFSMSESKRQLMPFVKMPVEHMVFSDGLATVSVFVEQEPAGAEEHLHGESQRGGVSVYAALVDGYRVTAVGDVPMATVKLMVNSVKQQN